MKYNTYIYDIEVFSHDWIVVLKRVGSKDYTVIVNDNARLKEFILHHKDDLLMGFNNKHYDDWIILSMLNGANNSIVKRHNDFIIGGGNGWEFPFIQFQKKPFKSGDLRDDLPINLSLKAIEANMLHNIKETSVDFNIDRPLTENELQLTIEYCKSDVDNAEALYNERKTYLDSKRMIAKLKGMDERDALGLTNAKLTAYFLDAVATKYDDEMEYTPPECLRLGKYNYVLDFFNDPVGYMIQVYEKELAACTRKVRIKSLEKKIQKLKDNGDRYECKLETIIAGIPHVYGWGGIHGAIKNYFKKSDDKHRIVTIDVGSYYPSMMLVFNYISRSIPSADGYRDVYDTRMKSKHEGLKDVADALKLILNTCYGAMKNKYNPLYDPKNASAICITGMLLLTDLIDKLENIKSFELIQSNTDGIIIRYAIEDEKKIESVVSEWESRTGMNMEYTIMHAIAQKDVNNYVMSAGETYLIKDGVKVVTGDANGKLKSKGGYVSLHKGGDYRNNSMSILHSALTKYFMQDVPVEETILKCNDISQFQIIAKTGSSYNGTYWIKDGEKVEVQRVNRVYASTNARYGTIYKRKNGVDTIASLEEKNAETGRNDKIASLPDHCLIDNEGIATIDMIDKQFYIDLALKRIKDYTGEESPKIQKKEVTKMATVKKDTLAAKIARVRSEFLKSNVKKSGINRFAGFKYFELADIVPVATKLCEDNGILSVVSFEDGDAVMTIHDMDNGQTITFKSPMVELDKRAQGMNSIQALGAIETYQRRYLYMLFLDIVEADTFDAGTVTETQEKAAAKEQVKEKAEKPAATKPVQSKEEPELTGFDDPASETTIKHIKRGLKKLREASADNEPYIADTLRKIKAGLTEADAQEILTITAEKTKAL